MAKYKLQDWERNGYDDSDFYGVYFDDETNKLESIELGSTRYAGGGYTFGPEYLMPTWEIVERARVALEDVIFEHKKRLDTLTVMEPLPSYIQRGTKLRLLEPHASMVKETEQRPCFKCNGSGRFIVASRRAPGGSKDAGQCFTCKGSGVLNYKTGSNVKGPDGKVLRIKLAVGDVVEALTTPAFFGVSYKNGYNQPNRFNTSVKVRSGTDVIRVPVVKLRLDREVESDEVLREWANKESFAYPFATYFGCRAWISTDFTKLIKEAA